MFENDILKERRCQILKNGDILRDYKLFLMENVENKTHKIVDYSLLLNTLFDIPFRICIEMDNNRVDDALYMRNEFLEDDICRGIDVSNVENRQVSVFEVLFALAKRMENDILCDPMEEFDHSADHFWMMLRNLGVEKYSNGRFLEGEVREKVDKFVRREYGRDGFGSIFPVKNKKVDMRKLEIWEQMNVFLMENL